MPNYCPRGRGLFNWSLQQGSAGCKIRVHRIFRVGPHGDDRSGVPLHERCDESDVYKGEVAQVDVVPELVGWFDGVINGLRSLQNILSVIFIKYYLTTRRTNDNTEYKYCTVAKVTICLFIRADMCFIYIYLRIYIIYRYSAYIYISS